MAKVNGTSGNVIYKSVEYPVTNWSGNLVAAVLPTTDTASGGWEESIGGVKSFTFSFSALYDSEKFAGDPPAFMVGDTGAFVLEITDGGDSFSGICLIESTNINKPVDGVVTYDVSARATGVVYLPGESLS